jgi:flagellar protein FlaF
MPVRSPLKAYETSVKSTLDGRALEAHVLIRGAQLMIECKEQWHEPGNNERLNQALGFNQKLWTFFQIELSNSEHPLPKKIREDLLNLAIFMDKRIYEMMTSPEPDKLDVMININQNIASGLQGIGVGS